MRVRLYLPLPQIELMVNVPFYYPPPNEVLPRMSDKLCTFSRKSMGDFLHIAQTHPSGLWMCLLGVMTFDLHLQTK